MSKRPRREYGEGMLDVGTAEMDASVVPTPWFRFRTTEKHPWRGVSERSVLHRKKEQRHTQRQRVDQAKHALRCDFSFLAATWALSQRGVSVAILAQ